jgi:hypothetical protein
MAKNRWDMGKPELGAGFDEGFISPWNDNVRDFSDFAKLETIPAGGNMPSTMAEQMDGDQNTTFSGGGRRRK